jgi:hypothetical protein
MVREKGKDKEIGCSPYRRHGLNARVTAAFSRRSNEDMLVKPQGGQDRGGEKENWMHWYQV